MFCRENQVIKKERLQSEYEIVYVGRTFTKSGKMVAEILRCEKAG